ncbi:hypothetical protein AB205_0185370 [Aquarana catesbeiana]|uniref:Immunoglobulin V-set domain-containing protein n=1 Tax=Aquarana catesbeiana TaxID=8400 RepID=A0A2G9S126_AQUCT|nr:hypothetical protein AB205_0185370 [Aquarana catesbeiana]
MPETKENMDILVTLGFALLLHSCTEGCTEVPSLSLSLFIGISQFNHSALRCQLCLDWTIHTPQEYTFTYFLNEHLVQITKKQDTKALYYLSNKKNIYGSWECKVEQYPSLRAVYYIGPQTSAPPASEDSARKHPTYITVPEMQHMDRERGVCVKLRHAGERQRSDNFPLTENLNRGTTDLNIDTSTEVSYVELEISQKPPSQKLLNPHSTVYATIM